MLAGVPCGRLPSPLSNPSQMKAFLVSAVAVLATAVIGGIGSAQAPLYYASVEKPPWAPPSWVFGPVWTVLYILIAVAGGMALQRAGRRLPLVLTIFFVQLALNALWSWIFFARQLPGVALVEIAILWAAVLANTIVFWRIRRAAGLLFLPYLAWVSFAAALNASFWLAR